MFPNEIERAVALRERSLRLDAEYTIDDLQRMGAIGTNDLCSCVVCQDYAWEPCD